MRNPSVNNETLSQLDVYSTENTHINQSAADTVAVIPVTGS